MEFVAAPPLNAAPAHSAPAHSDADGLEHAADAGPVEHAGGVVLRFGSSRYAIDMASVAEVVPVPVVTRVPGGPRWLLGVANWRGRVLPVVDLRPVLSAEDLPLASSARLVVVGDDGLEVGLIAEAVPGLLVPQPLRPTPGTVPPSAAALLRGVVDDSGPVSVLAPDALLDLRQELPSARRAS